MTVDREQVRRDAAKLPYSWERTTIETIVNHDQHANWWCGAAYGLAEAYLQKVAELEQAERERDEWIANAKHNAEAFDTEHESLALTSEALQDAEDKIDAAEARLAAVPALVEALRKISDHGVSSHAWAWCNKVARAALAAYEQAQGETP